MRGGDERSLVLNPQTHANLNPNNSPEKRGPVPNLPYMNFPAKERRGAEILRAKKQLRA